MQFPRLRYLQAGATPEEVDQLEAQHRQLPISAQHSTLERLAGVAQDALRADLEKLRADDELPDGTDPVPDASEDPDTVHGDESRERRDGGLLGVLDPPELHDVEDLEND